MPSDIKLDDCARRCLASGVEDIGFEDSDPAPVEPGERTRPGIIGPYFPFDKPGWLLPADGPVFPGEEMGSGSERFILRVSCNLTTCPRLENCHEALGAERS